MIMNKLVSDSVVAGLGDYIMRSLKDNTAVVIKHLGTFSLLQNYIQNEPVFFLSKDFIKGMPISSGVFTE